MPIGSELHTNRCTGKTTAEVLRIIYQAMACPGEAIPVSDKSLRVRERNNKDFANKVVNTIAKLGLLHFELQEFTPKNYTLTYNIYGEYEAIIKWVEVV